MRAAEPGPQSGLLHAPGAGADVPGGPDAAAVVTASAARPQNGFSLDLLEVSGWPKKRKGAKAFLQPYGVQFTEHLPEKGCETVLVVIVAVGKIHEL